MDTANKQIEQQITVLLRRVQRIHLSTTTGDVALERSAYGIMCKLADEGPQRLGALLAGDWPVIDASEARHRKESTGMVAAYLQWHLERGLKSLSYVDR